MNSLPFSPLTDAGLTAIINDRSSLVAYAVAHNRADTPGITAAAHLAYDMSRARTDRILATALRLGVPA